VKVVTESLILDSGWPSKVGQTEKSNLNSQLKIIILGCITGRNQIVGILVRSTHNSVVSQLKIASKPPKKIYLVASNS